MNIKQLGRQIMIGEKYMIEGFLCLLLLGMIFLACLQITLRTFFSGGLLWADPLLRHLVLWCGLLGAVVATREKKHICIDVAGYLTPEKGRPWLDLVIDIFSTLVATGITWAAVIFVCNELAFAGTSLLGIPSWFWVLIFPLAFGLMALHFFLAVIFDIRILFLSLTGDDNTPQESNQ